MAFNDGVIVVSAPGKVLLTGGYLILEQPNAGLVLSVTARFLAAVKALHQTTQAHGAPSSSEGERVVEVKVISPQMQRTTFYQLVLPSLVIQHAAFQGKAADLGKGLPAIRNPFVEKALQFSVAAAAEVELRKGGKMTEEAFYRRLSEEGLEITLLGQNDFYSNRAQLLQRGLPLSAESLASLPAFSPMTSNSPFSANDATPEVAKTGLGSSAAMTTSVVGALLHFLGTISIPRGTLASRHVSTSVPLPTSVVQDSEAPQFVTSLNTTLEGRSGGASQLASAINGNTTSKGLDESRVGDANGFKTQIEAPAAEHERRDLELANRVAQAAHCAAQGKVGSGFDVSAAVFGSQRYQRFSPALLAPLLADREDPGVDRAAVAKLLTVEWDGEHAPWKLPPGLVLMLGDVCSGGSSTPSMVGAVQRWRKNEGEQAARTWASLAAANQKVEESLRTLLRMAQGKSKDGYTAVLQKCRDLPLLRALDSCGDLSLEGAQETVDALMETRKAFTTVRSLLREIGTSAGVPIEPLSQTELLDATMEMPGVVFAGVPGAGGGDAVFAVALGKEARVRVEASWGSRGVLTLCAIEDPSGLRLQDPSSLLCYRQV
eukprot:TRINITY_DN11231_c0_g1_i1.p1 TRINITY_DN11231_c0_g1~~TRINITY_DN11231_c0_g1_i1.p1  ORF type:complete len:603 (-),score=108.99 TRINITY_DN11231_c0_g1_i1:370-2178(-)